MEAPRVCYVIMPFHTDLVTTYRTAIRPAIANVAKERSEEWACRRSDDIRVSDSITREIVSSLYTADLVIADLTGHNPNVFYELGVAHSAGRPTIMITQDIDELPFDLNTYRVHAYCQSDEGLRHLADSLTDTIRDTLSHQGRLTNPVMDFAPLPHADVILRLEDVQKLECQVRHEVGLIQPSLDTDLTLFRDVIKANILERGVKYRYIIPRTRTTERQWSRFLEAMGSPPPDVLQARTVAPHDIESEVVIFDPYTEFEDVLIMSPRETDNVFWYRVGKTRGEDIRERFEAIWENHAESINL